VIPRSSLLHYVQNIIYLQIKDMFQLFMRQFYHRIRKGEVHFAQEKLPVGFTVCLSVCLSMVYQTRFICKNIVKISVLCCFLPLHACSIIKFSNKFWEEFMMPTFFKLFYLVSSEEKLED